MSQTTKEGLLLQNNMKAKGHKEIMEVMLTQFISKIELLTQKWNEVQATTILQN